MLKPLSHATVTGGADARPWGQNAHPHLTQQEGRTRLGRSKSALSRTTGNLPPKHRAAETPKQASNLPPRGGVAPKVTITNTVRLRRKLNYLLVNTATTPLTLSVLHLSDVHTHRLTLLWVPTV